MPFETERLRVREFDTEHDTAALYRLSQEQGMRQFLPDQVYDDEEATEKVLRFLVDEYAKPDAVHHGVYVQGVECKTTGELIGHVGISPTDAGREIGYAIGQAHQGKGYATELVAGTLRWCFGNGFASLLGVVGSDNLRSIRVLEKTGFILIDERRRSLHGRTCLVQTYEAKCGACTCEAACS